MRSFDETNRMFREMDRVFGQFRSTWMDEFPAAEPGVRPALEGGEASAMSEESAASLEEVDDAYVFVLDLPGFEKEEIDLSFRDGVLSVRAHADAETGSGAYRALRSRRIARQVPVPKAVDEDGIAASYHNGVLEVRLPIVDDGDDHRIEIE